MVLPWKAWRGPGVQPYSAFSASTVSHTRYFPFSILPPPSLIAGGDSGTEAAHTVLRPGFALFCRSQFCIFAHSLLPRPLEMWGKLRFFRCQNTRPPPLTLDVAVACVRSYSRMPPLPRHWEMRWYSSGVRRFSSPGRFGIVSFSPFDFSSGRFVSSRGVGTGSEEPHIPSVRVLVRETCVFSNLPYLR